MKNKIFLLLCLIQTCVICKGQPYYFQNFQADDGLLHSNVTSIMQDSRGFIWIGTRGGLNKFDGYSFKNFLITQKRSGINYISALTEDKKGNIWIGTLSGLFKYRPEQESIAELKMSHRPGIYDLKMDQDDNLWMLSGRRIFRYNSAKNKLSTIETRGYAIGIGAGHSLWIGTEERGLKRYDIRTGKLSEIKLSPRGLIPPFADITRIHPVDNRVLIGTTQGLFCYDILKGTSTVLLSKNADGTEIYIRDIKIAADGKYWLATESGIYIYDPEKSDFINLKKRPGDPYSITDNAVYSLCHDNRGGVWAGTFFGGLNYRSLQNNQFEKYFPLNTANSISGNAVREIGQDSTGNIWIGTEDAGINKLDRKTGKFSHFTTGAASSNLSYPNIHGLLISGDKLFVGPFMHGMEVLDLSSGRVIERYPNLQLGNSRSSSFAMSIFKTAAGKILVGSTGAGLSSYDPVSKRLRLIEQIPDDSFVFDIAEDYTGIIWTGSMANGAFFFNPKTGAHGNIRFNKNKDGSTSDNSIQGIYEDSKQALWFATDGGGLIRLSKDRKTFKRFTTKSGFPTDNIFRTLEDNAQHLWISTLKGLVCLDLNTEKFHVYSKSNGLLTDQFNYNSAFKARDGKMYFGSVKGMIAFRPEALKLKTQVPPIYITAFDLHNNKSLSKGSDPLYGRAASLLDSVELDYNQSTFDIEFAALDYSASDAIRYRYRMEGLGDDWTYLSKNRKAYFTDLSPGEYKFVVQAESNIGLWKTPQRTMYIKINPPFWKSITAYIFYVSFFVLAGYLLVRSYHRTLNKRNQRKLKLFQLEKEKEVYHAKIEFFTNIAHEIQTPLTLIKGPIDWTLDKIDDAAIVRRNLKLVKKNISRLLSLTSQLLDFRKTETDQFGLNFVAADINQLVKDRLTAFKPHISERNVDIRLHLPEKPIKAYVDKEAFTKILGNLLSNAIKYSDKRIVISLLIPEDDPERFRLRIENDGQLIPEQYQEKIFEPFYRVRNETNTKGTGIGLPLAKSLAELHQGSLLLLGNTELNIFELTLPIHQAFEFELERSKSYIP